MGVLDWFRRPAPVATGAPQAMTLNSPEFYEMVRGGDVGGPQAALKNSAVFRCVDLVSSSLGMLPLEVKVSDGNGQMIPARTEALYKLLMYRPNPWQTAFEFKQIMTAWLLIDGNAYARIVRTGQRVSSLVPIPSDRVAVQQRDDYSISYTVTSPKAGASDVPANEMLHLRSLSLDGVTGLSRVKQAADIINTALQAQRAADRVFRNGVIAGVALEHPGKLSIEAREFLKASLESYAGADNAGRSMVLEEGMTRSFPPMDSQKAQLTEIGAAQVEAIARVFGVPRPLMMVDDTSWGSGIEQLAILFVRFGLAPIMKVWEDAITRSLIPEAKWGQMVPDYDERELLRGTLKDQAEFFAKALGSGGHRPWMTANEVRDLSGLGQHAGGEGLIAAGERLNDTAQSS